MLTKNPNYVGGWDNSKIVSDTITLLLLEDSSACLLYTSGMEWHQTMAKYIIKRVAMGIISIFIVATVAFFVMNLVPGGPFVAAKSISAAAQQALAEKYSLDKPLGAQYVNYMKGLLHGDLGPVSYTHLGQHGHRAERCDHRPQPAGAPHLPV